MGQERDISHYGTSVSIPAEQTELAVLEHRMADIADTVGSSVQPLEFV